MSVLHSHVTVRSKERDWKTTPEHMDINTPNRRKRTFLMVLDIRKSKVLSDSFACSSFW